MLIPVAVEDVVSDLCNDLTSVREGTDWYETQSGYSGKIRISLKGNYVVVVYADYDSSEGWYGTNVYEYTISPSGEVLNTRHIY